MFKKTIISLIEAYQRTLSPDKGIFRKSTPTCRFYPSCSEYTKQAVGKYGVIKGILKGLFRIKHCHPFNPGGYDPLL
ncbi:MAG: membrane protein insertion efficiency factor YidD [Candidatus Portnoybacteria bacterium]|nr:membrane protein insertion efficiency factor YidD [Candidatus Portnoybacteria bacterium]MDD4982714.1 membrane protein insertion efficiency factor YidD [Candidatus Portnoybacteria bacterium]